jgi:polar amino acid transport system substrate-binding protein
MTPLLLRAALVLALVLAPQALRSEDALARIGAQGVVTAGAVPDKLPTSGYDAKGELAGFDIDVSREIGRRLGAQVAFAVSDFATVLSGDWHGRFDFCACSITPTKERAERLAFPAAYRFDAAVLVVRAEDRAIATIADASGKRIGVKADTTFQRYLERNLVIFAGTPVTYQIEKPTIVTFADKDGSVQALRAGEVDAAIVAFVTARGAIEAGAPLRIVPGFLFFEPVAVAALKDEKALNERIGQAVQAMHEDGTLTELSLKWFGIDLTRVLK